jgi:hypothetical protein
MFNGCIEENVITGIRSWDPAIMGAAGVSSGPFEGKLRIWTFTKLPNTDFEPHGIQVGPDFFATQAFPDDQENAMLADKPYYHHMGIRIN